MRATPAPPRTKTIASEPAIDCRRALAGRQPQMGDARPGGAEDAAQVGGGDLARLRQMGDVVLGLAPAHASTSSLGRWSGRPATISGGSASITSIR